MKPESEKALNFLIGKVMELSNKRADPKEVRRCLIKLLGGSL